MSIIEEIKTAFEFTVQTLIFLIVFLGTGFGIFMAGVVIYKLAGFCE